MSCEELCHTVKELANVLDSGDDLEKLIAVAENGEKILKLTEQQNLEVKRCVQELAKLADEEGKVISTLLQENKENNKAISKLKQQKHTKVAEIEELGTALGLIENSIREIDLESGKLNNKKAGVQHQVKDVLPQTKYAFSLYSNITRLRWDYSMDDDKLQGYVTSLRDVRPFCLDMKEHSPHFIANYLWDVIASAKNSQE